MVSRSALVTTCSGTQNPVPVMAARGMGRLLAQRWTAMAPPRSWRFWAMKASAVWRVAK